MDEVLTLSAAEIVRRIRARELDVSKVVEAHIQRIQQVNPQLNAVITPMFEQAREQAAQMTAQLEDGMDDLPPLFGLPVTIKDCFPVKDVRFTAGSWFMRDNIAENDAAVVRKCREAGAIILGKTNLPDMCLLPETTNPIFGRTVNPWNKKHSPSGSSGGEGAIIAAGGSPLGVGSDIAGSVRTPAAVTGIVALKPTAKRIPTEGHVPAIESDVIDGWNTAGPMARRIEDLALALSVLSETPVRDYKEISLARRRLTVYINNPFSPVQTEVAETVMMAAGALKCADMDIVRDDSLPVTQVGLAYVGLLTREYGPTIRRALGGGQPYELMEEFRRNDKRISTQVLFLAEAQGLYGKVVNLARLGGEKRLQSLKQRMLEMMTPGGVLLTPVIPTVPPQHGWTWWYVARPPFTFVFNALGFPAVSVPICFTKNGLPLSVQVVAAPGEDETALAVAAELERIFGGWQIATMQ